MKFSLIVATINRTEPLENLLQSVRKTPEALSGDVQVIVVDQNKDDRLVPLLAPLGASLNLLHLRSVPGVSRARNAALSLVTGQVVAFPDDDCLYHRSTLTNVCRQLELDPDCAGLSGRVLGFDGRPYNLRWPEQAEPIQKRRVWMQALSVSLFLRRTVVDSVGMFDESLGVGAGTRWGSGEETDYVLRALSAGYLLRFDPSIEILHPAAKDRFDLAQRARAYAYALGMGRVLRTHSFPVRDRLKFVLRPALGSLLYAAQFHFSGARYHAGVAKGRLQGMLSR